MPRGESVPMEDVERVSPLIQEIYDAALSPSLWPGVLGKCAQYVGDPAAALFSQDAASAALGIRRYEPEGPW